MTKEKRETILQAAAALEMVVSEIVDHAYQNRSMFELMRSVPVDADSYQQWDQMRQELTSPIESVLRHGNCSGEFCDPHPELTARFVPGLVRSLLLYGTGGLDRRTVAEHILRLLRASLCCGSMGVSQPQAQQSFHPNGSRAIDRNREHIPEN